MFHQLILNQWLAGSIADSDIISNVRNTLTLIGLGFIILFAGVWYAFGHVLVPNDDTNENFRINSTNPMASELKITSPAFEQNASIPSKFTCDAGSPPAGGSPPLAISGVPEGAKSLALIMDDPDVPKQLKPDGVFDHWVLFNISPATTEISEGGSVGTPGANSAGKNAYYAPCPPPQYEPSEHRYVFALYALDTELALKAGTSKADVLKALEGHVLAQAQLVGKYKRQ